MKNSRRQVIRQSALIPGAAAVSPLLLPFMQRAHADAQGAPPPKRFIFVVKSSGMTPAELVPRQLTGELVEVGDANNPGPNYGQALSLKSVDKLVDRPLSELTLHESADRTTCQQAGSDSRRAGHHVRQHADRLFLRRWREASCELIRMALCAGRRSEWTAQNNRPVPTVSRLSEIRTPHNRQPVQHVRPRGRTATKHVWAAGFQPRRSQPVWPTE